MTATDVAGDDDLMVKLTEKNSGSNSETTKRRLLSERYRHDPEFREWYRQQLRDRTAERRRRAAERKAEREAEREAAADEGGT